MSKNKDIYGTITTYNDSNSRIVLKADSIVDSIVDKFIDRSRVGKAKYGVTLDREDWSLDQWIEAAIEEHMDAILYLQKIRTVVGGKKNA
jgi:hypothetical protein